MKTPLDALGATLPVLAAPMAGGPSTPELVIAAASARSMGFLAAGYKSAEALEQQIREVAARTDRFAVNLFAPNPVPIDAEGYAAYAMEIRNDAAALGVDSLHIPLREDDDSWEAKLDVLLTHPVPAVSFTFGLPAAEVVARLRSAGTVVLQSVTNVAEAAQAHALGVDLLVLQAPAAGGHSATLTPARPVADRSLVDLIREVRASVALPVIGGGGIASSLDVAAALRAGAAGVAVGTLLLRSYESGASRTHKAALGDPRFVRTAVTTAFTGRPARGLENAFLTSHRRAPLGYPAIHFLTSQLRRNAAEAGDAERLHLWAGTGFRAAREAPTAEILRDLAR